MLQQHDGLAVLDLAAGDHRQRLRERQLQHLDVLAFVGLAAAGVAAVGVVVRGDEEVQLLGDRARAHVGLEHLARRLHVVAGLLDRLALHRGERVVAVQLAGAGLDQQAVGAAVDPGGEAELARQDHRAARGVEQQQRDAVAAVVGLAADHLQAAVAAAVLEGGLAQQVPVVREHALLEDADLARCRRRGADRHSVKAWQNRVVSCSIVQTREIRKPLHGHAPCSPRNARSCCSTASPPKASSSPRRSALELGTSEDTIRRDLRELAAEGKLQRVHGGALPASAAMGDLARARAGRRWPTRWRSGRFGASLIQPGQVVILDGGTTALQVARHLAPGLRATVVTHSPTVAVELAAARAASRS